MPQRGGARRRGGGRPDIIADPPPGPVHSTHTATDADHGRVEERRHADEPRFPHLAMIGMVETRVERGGEVQNERRHDLPSTRLGAETFADAVRTHRHIGNRLHWTLDVVVHDDLVRLRTAHGPENMAVIRHCAMNLVRSARISRSVDPRRCPCDEALSGSA